MATDGAPGPVRLVHHMHPVTRLLLAGFGVFALVAPALDFGAALLEPTLFTIPLWIITIGAAAIGVVLLASAILGETTELVVGAGTITLTRRRLFRRECRVLAPAEITAIGIRRVEWDSGPDTFAVEVHLTSGAPVGSDARLTRAGAETLAAALRGAVGHG